MNDHGECELVDKKNKKKQEEEDPEQAQGQRHHQLVAAACQDSTKSNSLRPLPVASCSDQGSDEMAADASAAAARSNRKKNKKEAAQAAGGRLAPSRRHWWGDCAPHVVLLREALLSSAPDIAVLGPLHGCFAFYMDHLHNEVLSSTYARTMTFGADVTRLESGFMWVGGWRPTSALVLVYSLMGIDIENALEAVQAGRDGVQSSTSSLLSTRQLAVMHTLQKHTQHAEMKISKKLTVLQMLIGDQDVLGAVLLDAASPVINDSSRFHQVIEKRMYRLRRLLVQAEELRLHTLKDLLSLLTPIQAARCGVAVFEICSSLRITGSQSLPRLPTVAISPLSVVPIPLLPALPSGFVDYTPLVVAGFGEQVITDLLSSDNILNSDVPLSHSSIALASDSFTSGSNIPNSSDAPFSHSDEPPLMSDQSSSSENLNASDDLFRQSDQTSLLVPSCSNSSSSQPLAQDSSRGLLMEQRSRSLPTIRLPLLELKLDDDDTDGNVPAPDEQHASRVGNSEEREVISNRLLVLSPASSDVVIQNCSLDTAELNSYFEMPPQLPQTNDDMRTDPHQAESSESGEIGGAYQIQPCSRPMSVLCECAQQGSQPKGGREKT